jgi:hypothetical protein
LPAANRNLADRFFDYLHINSGWLSGAARLPYFQLFVFIMIDAKTAVGATAIAVAAPVAALAAYILSFDLSTRKKYVFEYNLITATLVY